MKKSILFLTMIMAYAPLTRASIFSQSDLCIPKLPSIQELDSWVLLPTSHDYFVQGQHLFLADQLQEASSYFMIAAEKGHAGAQNDLGHMYRHGIGVQQDYDKAWKWFNAAGDQGLVYALLNQASMYEKGEGCEENFSKARALYQKAAKQDFHDGRVKIALMYLDGRGVIKNTAKAIKLLEGVAMHVPEANLHLGNIYYLGGETIKKNDAIAAHYYTLAANGGNRAAQYNLAQLYKEGHGVPLSPACAIEYFTRAAEQNLPDAQYELGVAYYTMVTPPDYPRAFYWLNLAARNNHGPAISFLQSDTFYAPPQEPSLPIEALDDIESSLLSPSLSPIFTGFPHIGD